VIVAPGQFLPIVAADWLRFVPPFSMLRLRDPLSKREWGRRKPRTGVL
jgi:hypothetical protein